MQIRNPQYNAFGTIDCEIEHPQFGWIPFTAAPDDVEPHGRQVYETALGLGPAAYVAPAVVEPTPEELLIQWRATASLSRAEFCIALKRAGILSASEAKQAAKGDWPETFADALAGFPDADEAEITWAAITTVDRMHPMLLALQAFASLSDEFVDGLFGWTAA